MPQDQFFEPDLILRVPAPENLQNQPKIKKLNLKKPTINHKNIEHINKKSQNHVNNSQKITKKMAKTIKNTIIIKPPL